jgi:hypothetical protein
MTIGLALKKIIEGDFTKSLTVIAISLIVLFDLLLPRNCETSQIKKDLTFGCSRGGTCSMCGTYSVRLVREHNYMLVCFLG